jgi:multiple sugar transport system substrate-binding protein
MTDLTRRDALAIGAAAIGASALPLIGARAAVTDVPMADVKPPTYDIEKGASLRIMRPAKFVDPDETLFRANTKAFTDKTGVPVRVDFVSWEDVLPQTAVAANTGAGPDVIVGFGSAPQIYAPKLVDMSDLANYLGAKYGGWFNLAELYGQKWGTKDWISLPMGGSTGPSVYRVSWLKEAGYDTIPNDTQGFLEMCQKLKKIGHPAGFSLGHALGDATGYANWLLWIHNAYLVDENNKIALDSKETIAALKYANELQKTLIDGTLSWNDAGNNQAFIAGQISLTFNGISIYYALKNSKDPAQQAMAADTSHQLQPTGFAKASSVQTATVINAMLFKHSKYPNAAKEYLRFMMEADQYGPWLQGFLGQRPRAGALLAGDGHHLLRRLQGTHLAGFQRRRGELHGGGHVRLGRHRQCHPGGRRQAGRGGGGALLQQGLSRLWTPPQRLSASPAGPTAGW